MQKIAVIKTIAIHPNFQRKGYGTKLLQHIIHKIEIQKNACSIYYPAWKESACDGFCKLLINKGFKEVKEYKNYWSADSVQNNYSCVKCGNPPCNCTMVLFKKTLNI
jgi:ribosomal protein S18 acetylase RimI-like enzyme